MIIEVLCLCSLQLETSLNVNQLDAKFEYMLLYLQVSQFIVHMLEDNQCKLWMLLLKKSHINLRRFWYHGIAYSNSYVFSQRSQCDFSRI